MATRLLILSEVEKPSVYFTQMELEELVAVLHRQSKTACIYELTTNEVQTPNNFRGYILKTPKIIEPNLRMSSLFYSYMLEFMSLGREQVLAEVDRAVEQLNEYKQRFIPIEVEPQTEVIDLTPPQGNPADSYSSEPTTPEPLPTGN